VAKISPNPDIRQQLESLHIHYFYNCHYNYNLLWSHNVISYMIIGLGVGGFLWVVNDEHASILHRFEDSEPESFQIFNLLNWKLAH